MFQIECRVDSDQFRGGALKGPCGPSFDSAGPNRLSPFLAHPGGGALAGPYGATIDFLDGPPPGEGARVGPREATIEYIDGRPLGPRLRGCENRLTASRGSVGGGGLSGPGDPISEGAQCSGGNDQPS